MVRVVSRTEILYMILEHGYSVVLRWLYWSARKREYVYYIVISAPTETTRPGAVTSYTRLAV